MRKIFALSLIACLALSGAAFAKDYYFGWTNDLGDNEWTEAGNWGVRDENGNAYTNLYPGSVTKDHEDYATIANDNVSIAAHRNIAIEGLELSAKTAPVTLTLNSNLTVADELVVDSTAGPVTIEVNTEKADVGTLMFAHAGDELTTTSAAGLDAQTFTLGGFSFVPDPAKTTLTDNGVIDLSLPFKNVTDDLYHYNLGKNVVLQPNNANYEQPHINTTGDNRVHYAKDVDNAIVLLGGAQLADLNGNSAVLTPDTGATATIRATNHATLLSLYSSDPGHVVFNAPAQQISFAKASNLTGTIWSMGNGNELTLQRGSFYNSNSSFAFGNTSKITVVSPYLTHAVNPNKVYTGYVAGRDGLILNNLAIDEDVTVKGDIYVNGTVTGGVTYDGVINFEGGASIKGGNPDRTATATVTFAKEDEAFAELDVVDMGAATLTELDANTGRIVYTTPDTVGGKLAFHNAELMNVAATAGYVDINNGAVIKANLKETLVINDGKLTINNFLKPAGGYDTAALVAASLNPVVFVSKDATLSLNYPLVVTDVELEDGYISYLYIEKDGTLEFNFTYNSYDSVLGNGRPAHIGSIFTSAPIYRNSMSRVIFKSGSTLAAANGRYVYIPKDFESNVNVLGDITLKIGTKAVMEFEAPRFTVPEGHTLTVTGDGTLTGAKHFEAGANLRIIVPATSKMKIGKQGSGVNVDLYGTLIPTTVGSNLSGNDRPNPFIADTWDDGNLFVYDNAKIDLSVINAEILKSKDDEVVKRADIASLIRNKMNPVIYTSAKTEEIQKLSDNSNLNFVFRANEGYNELGLEAGALYSIPAFLVYEADSGRINLSADINATISPYTETPADEPTTPGTDTPGTDEPGDEPTDTPDEPNTPDTPNTPSTNKSSSSGGCSAGIASMALLLAIPMLLKRK